MPEDKPLTVDEVIAAESSAVRRGAGPLSALCISGGGIRSATFALGVMQGLAERGMLEQFDYLSTVSGGGYIGGWLTAWKHRVRGLKSVVPHLRRDALPPAPGEPDPIQHLREYNRYLSPRAGALSTDLWTLLATVFRNVLLNWLLFIPVLMLALIVPRLFLSFIAFPAGGVSGQPLVRWGLPVASGLLLTCALFFILRSLPGVGNRNDSRFDFLLRVLIPLAAAALTLMAFDALDDLGRLATDRSGPWDLVVGAVVASAVAWLLSLAVRQRRSTASLGVVSMAVGTGLAAWVATNFILFKSNPGADLSWAAFVTLGLPVILCGFCLGAVLFVGFTSAVLEDADREWMSRAVAEVLLVALVWLVICATDLLFPKWALAWRWWGHGLLAATAALSAWLSTHSEAFATKTSSALATRAAPIVFLVLLGGALSVFTNVLLWAMHAAAHVALVSARGAAITWSDHYGMLERSHPGLVVLLAAVLLTLVWVTSRYINVNTFSLHGMYCDRLVQAYLGASNPKPSVNLFTGFARNDDIRLADLDTSLKPFHLLNLTLNVVATSRLDWQQRKAESFTATPLHCGNATLGYRPSSGYAGGITLGSAIALSGAAASPNMGYHSSPVLTFVMTLFNARLGAWLGNPGTPGDRSWTMRGPRSAARSLIREAFGETTDEREFVYLSDGGHFENLGLYEMVRRRCRLIVVIDGGCDPGFVFEDLGNALRKIRIDFKIPIRFQHQPGSPLGDRTRRCALATIDYSAVDGPCEPGRLIYIKPLLLGTETPDVRSYADAYPTFPHQSTAEQWFDESQTESYRELGVLTFSEMCRGWEGGALADLYGHLERVYLAGA